MQAFHRAIEDEAEQYWPITAEKLRGFGKWRATSTYVNPEEEMLDLLVRTLDGEFGPRQVNEDGRTPRRAAERAKMGLKMTAVWEKEHEEQGRLVVKLPVPRENLESLILHDDVQRTVPSAHKPTQKKRKNAVGESLQGAWPPGFSKPGPKKKRRAEAWETVAPTGRISKEKGIEKEGADEAMGAGLVEIVPQERVARKVRRMVVAGGDEDNEEAKEEKARVLMAQRTGR